MTQTPQLRYSFELCCRFKHALSLRTNFGQVGGNPVTPRVPRGGVTSWKRKGREGERERKKRRLASLFLNGYSEIFGGRGRQRSVSEHVGSWLQFQCGDVPAGRAGLRVDGAVGRGTVRLPSIVGTRQWTFCQPGSLFIQIFFSLQRAAVLPYKGLKEDKR